MKKIRNVALIALLIAGTFSFVSYRNYSSNDEVVVAKAPKVGEEAPEINLNSPDGEAIPLSSLHGKMVLIDFWASWCGPCRRENPNVVSAYNQFKDKSFQNAEGFTIYGVSLDVDVNKWKNAIAADNLSWEYHVSDLQGWSNAAASLYGVNSIPANFLIDGNGVIVATNLRGSALDKELEKHLNKNKE